MSRSRSPLPVPPAGSWRFDNRSPARGTGRVYRAAHGERVSTIHSMDRRLGAIAASRLSMWRAMTIPRRQTAGNVRLSEGVTGEGFARSVHCSAMSPFQPGWMAPTLR